MGDEGLSDRYTLREIFDALLDGKMVVAGDIAFTVTPKGRLQSCYKSGTWSEAELFNMVDFIGDPQEADDYRFKRGKYAEEEPKRNGVEIDETEPKHRRPVDSILSF